MTLQSPVPSRDFANYLAAVSDNGARTRRILFVIALIGIFIMCAFRLNTPDWGTARYQEMRHYYECWLGVIRPDCVDLRNDYHDDFPLPNIDVKSLSATQIAQIKDYDLGTVGSLIDKERYHVFMKRLDALVQRSIDENVLSIPFLT